MGRELEAHGHIWLVDGDPRVDQTAGPGRQGCSSTANVALSRSPPRLPPSHLDIDATDVHHLLVPAALAWTRPGAPDLDHDAAWC